MECLKGLLSSFKRLRRTRRRRTSPRSRRTIDGREIVW